jgi:4-carboxymuconolactone decarboxylase
MGLDRPRITPLAPEQWPEEVGELLRSLRELIGYDMNLFSTLARHPKLYKRFTVFGNHVRMKSSLRSRDRELLILRTCWLCDCSYDFTHHTTVGRALGIEGDQIERIKQGPDAEGWGEFDAALLRAADELHANGFVSDATWSTLAARYSTEQLMDVVFCVGQYVLVSMAVKSFGIQLEDWAHDHQVARSLPPR